MRKSLFAMFFMMTIIYAQTTDSKSESTNIESLNWLSGSWIAEQDSSIVEELWMTPGGNIMLGTGRTVSPEGKASFEFMRIAQTDSGLYFFGSPNGESPTPFKLTKAGKNSLQFENLSHDFPQRIIYRLIGPENLHARVEGMINNRLEFAEWNYRRIIK